MRKLICALCFVIIYISFPPDMLTGSDACDIYKPARPDKKNVECILYNFEDKYFFEFEKYDADYVAIMLAIAKRESNFVENLIVEEKGGKDYSVGIWQVRCDTAQYFLRLWDCDKRKILLLLQSGDFNCFAASEYFLKKLKRYKNLPDAAAAYNSGKIKRRPGGDYINAAYVSDILLYYKAFLAQK